MNNSSLIGKTVDAFRSQFRDMHLTHETVEMDKSLAHSFFIDFGNAEALSENWQQIANFIALHFQNKLDDEFQRWNIYLFFRVVGPVGKELKYKIENDTFSSRKVIIESSMDSHSAIKVHIVNELTQIGAENLRTKTQLEHNPMIREVLKGKTLKKSKITPEAQKAYDKLLENLKKGNEV
ncbi:ABC-three component system middle component 1 [Flagellimonas sp.]|uniref:ABC-three component system middle component 1 n=1 Tax=Flagellimonas sp. TaxID=2058762 RepID=UPI003BAEDDC7